jgi:hypothetical protein
MKRFRERLGDILWHHDIEYAELVHSVITLAWGLWLAVPGWNQFNSHFYNAMRQLGPEAMWAAIITAIGAYRLWALLADQLVHRLRAGIYFLLLWLFFTAMVWMSDPRLPGTVICPTIALSAWWVCVRLTRRLSR